MSSKISRKYQQKQNTIARIYRNMHGKTNRIPSIQTGIFLRSNSIQLPELINTNQQQKGLSPKPVLKNKKFNSYSLNSNKYDKSIKNKNQIKQNTQKIKYKIVQKRSITNLSRYQQKLNKYLNKQSAFNKQATIYNITLSNLMNQSIRSSKRFINSFSPKITYTNNYYQPKYKSQLQQKKKIENQILIKYQNQQLENLQKNKLIELSNSKNHLELLKQQSQRINTYLQSLKNTMTLSYPIQLKQRIKENSISPKMTLKVGKQDRLEKIMKLKKFNQQKGLINEIKIPKMESPLKMFKKRQKKKVIDQQILEYAPWGITQSPNQQFDQIFRHF